MTAPRTLDEKQAEKARLLKAFRAARREDWRGLIEKEPRILGFKRALRRETDPRAFIRRFADCWLRSAPNDVRYAALRLIDRHANRMARFEGRAVLDDPLPPARNLFLAAREMLAVR